jgi:hypothetical protein
MKLVLTFILERLSLKSTSVISVPLKWSEYFVIYISSHLVSYKLQYSSLLHGNPTKARNVLGWKPTVGFDDLVKEMVESDLKVAANLVEDQN